MDLTPRAYSLPKNLPGEEKKAAGKEAANYDNRTPGVSIHYKDAVELVTRGAAKACLSVEQETVARTSRNVVARIKGTDKAEEILTLTAHYDSVPEGPGAYDNMSGAAIIMELADIQRTQATQNNGIRMVWCRRERSAWKSELY